MRTKRSKSTNKSNGKEKKPTAKKRIVFYAVHQVWEGKYLRTLKECETLDDAVRTADIYGRMALARAALHEGEGGRITVITKHRATITLPTTFDGIWQALETTKKCKEVVAAKERERAVEAEVREAAKARTNGEAKAGQEPAKGKKKLTTSRAGKTRKRQGATA